MYIFSLLGQLTDMVFYHGVNSTVYDENHICIQVTSINLIDNCILPLCEDAIDERYVIVESGQCKVVYLDFEINQNNHRAELHNIKFVTPDGKAVIIDISTFIINLLCADELDERYYRECEDIFYKISS